MVCADVTVDRVHEVTPTERQQDHQETVTFGDIHMVMPGVAQHHKEGALEFFLKRSLKLSEIRPKVAPVAVVSHDSATVTISVDARAADKLRTFVGRLNTWYSACRSYAKAFDPTTCFPGLTDFIPQLGFCWGGAMAAPAMVFLRNPVDKDVYKDQFVGTTGQAWMAVVLWAKLAVCTVRGAHPDEHMAIDRIAFSALDLTPLADEGFAPKEWEINRRTRVKEIEARWSIDKHLGQNTWQMQFEHFFAATESSGGETFTVFVCDQSDSGSAQTLLRILRPQMTKDRNLDSAVLLNDGKNRPFNVGVLSCHPSALVRNYKGAANKLATTFATVYRAVHKMMLPDVDAPTHEDAIIALAGVNAFDICAPPPLNGFANATTWVTAAKSGLVKEGQRRFYDA